MGHTMPRYALPLEAGTASRPGHPANCGLGTLGNSDAGRPHEAWIGLHGHVTSLAGRIHSGVTSVLTVK